MLILPIALLALMSAIMFAGWAYQRAVRNGGWTDVFWTYGAGACGVLAAVWPLDGQPTQRQILVAALAAAWSLRLGTYVALRVARSDEEDDRYARFRKDWGAGFQAKMFGFLQVQALAALILLVPILVAARRAGEGLIASDWIGLVVMIVAIGGESLSDWQLARFRADPANKGKINDRGLWAWSRHPNYFFEWFGWLAYPIIAIDLGGGRAWGFAALIGPAYMFYLLRFVTGVPPLEASMRRSRGAAFDAYAARTSIFIPLPPKSAP